MATLQRSNTIFAFDGSMNLLNKSGSVSLSKISSSFICLNRLTKVEFSFVSPSRGNDAKTFSKF